MKLLLKFNLIFVLVFAAGLAVTAYIARDLLRANAEAEVAGNARLLMESAVAAAILENSRNSRGNGVTSMARITPASRS